MRKGSLLPEPRGILFEFWGNYLAAPGKREVPLFVSGPQPMPAALRLTTPNSAMMAAWFVVML
jgi:hypothetical protein